MPAGPRPFARAGRRNLLDAARAGGTHQSGNLARSTLAASQSGLALERAAPDRGAAGWFDPALEEAVTNLLVRQKHVLLGKAYSPDSLITEPMGGQAIAERIARFSREDVRERVLAQEILLSLDILVKLEPELLRGFLTVRVGY